MLRDRIQHFVKTVLNSASEVHLFIVNARSETAGLIMVHIRICVASIPNVNLRFLFQDR